MVNQGLQEGNRILSLNGGFGRSRRAQLEHGWRGEGVMWGVRKSRVARESGIATPFSAGRGALRLLEPYILVMLGSSIPAFSTFFVF